MIARRILLQLQGGTAAPQAELRGTPRAPAQARGDLTERELQVLQLVAQGYSNREIGEALHVSVNTVEAHAKNIFRKLEVRTRGAAVHSATQRGWLG